MDATKEEETYEFQAEVGRVMDIIINSLYSDKDIFLRELVSNAADACDKKRFLSVTSDAKDADTTPPQIKIRADPENQLVIIEDTGVGMTKDELINNLGKIAQSGTKNFMQALGEGKADVNLIGQFGVGFYSAYLVAEKVEVITKSMQAGSPQLRWESDSGSKFTISDASDAEPIEGSGTRLILHMKDDAMQYLESSKLEELLQRYSEFIEFPISIYKEETTYEKVPDEEANKELKEGEEPKMKTIPVTKSAYATMNSQKPIWLRPVKEVEDEEYKQFYKSAFRASYDEPQKWSHFRMEGQVECKALLYIPGMLPFELSKDMFDEDARNIRLYVKRVFINDKFDDIMPRWLKFIKGVVDSDDLPLNVSREILQKSKVLSIINKRLVRKSIDMFKDIAADEDPSKYIMFWNNFGKYLKVGVIDDEKNKDELVPLLRFFSSKSGEEYTSFDKYVEGMPEGQKSIYYVTGEGRKNAMLQPVIEKFASRGYEVLLMTEPLDEITIENVRKYKDFNVVDATKEGLDLEEDEESKKEAEKLNEKYAQVIEYLEVELEGKVQKVKVSKLLTNSPAALVQGAYGVSPTMQRYMKAQSVASGGTGNLGSMNQAVLEINPNHPIVIDLERMIQKDKDSPETKTFAMLMYDIASLTGGYEISDTGDFAKRVMAMMTTKAKDDVAKDDTEAKPAEDTKSSDDDEDKAVDPEVIV
jgi:heat shock protein beta